MHSGKLSALINKKFVSVPEGASQASILKQFDRDVTVLPVMGDTGSLIDIILKEDFSVMDTHLLMYSVEPLPELHFLAEGDVTLIAINGAVLNAAINRYCNVFAKRSDRQIHLVSFDLDKEFKIDDFEELELIPSISSSLKLYWC